MNSSRIELLWLVWNQSWSKNYLRTKFQDGIDIVPCSCIHVIELLCYNWRFGLKTGDFLSTYLMHVFIVNLCFHSSYETLLIRQKCKQYILKWDAVGSILKQTKRKHKLTIKTCIKYVDKKSRYETKSPAQNLQIPTLLKGRFCASPLNAQNCTL
jgi:hypothetical protein